MIRHIRHAHRVVMSHPVAQSIKHHFRRRVVAGFTLIEVLIVVSVVGVLASATTTRISNQQEVSRNIARKTMVGQLASAITTFYSNNRYWPNDLGLLNNYINTIPTDPKGIGACSSTSSGQYGYLRYTGGGLSGDKDGFMIFAQVERGGQGIDHSKLYVLTGSNPCQAGAAPDQVDRYRIANSACTTKPGWTDNNPGWSGPMALNSLQQDIADVFGNQKAYAQTSSAPKCDGKTATIWIKSGSPNRIMGGPSSGTIYTGNVIITGTSSADVIVGGDLNHIILGLGGNDTICGGNGGSRINGGDGNDWINGGWGSDIIYGGNGNDEIYSDTAGGGNGAMGNDWIDGGAGTDTVYAAVGYDYCQNAEDINAGGCQNTTWSDPGRSSNGAATACTSNSFVTSCNADFDGDGVSNPVEGNNSDTDSDGIPDYMEGLLGYQDRDGDSIPDQYDNDEPRCNGLEANIYISPIINGNKYIIGGSNNLSIYNGTLTVPNGNWVIVGTDGNDVINIGDGNQTVCGGNGSNTITMKNGNQTVIGGDGDDYIRMGDGQKQVYLGNGTNDVKVGNGNQRIVGGDGYDKVEAGDGNHIFSLGSGNDQVYHVGNGNTSIACGAGTDNVREKGQGQFACSSCESGCATSGSPTTPAVATGITYPPSANTVTCNTPTTSVASDPDGDSYVIASGVTNNYGNADSNDNNPCLPNAMVQNCTGTGRSNIPGGTCDDNDNDGYKNNVYHTLAEWDPNDQDPCNPASNSCNLDIDEDGYKRGLNIYPSDPLYDPDDNDKCIPLVFRPGCNRNTDGDSRTDAQEGEFANTDTFFGYPTVLGFDIYSGAYATIINQGGRTSFPTGDQFLNRNDSDIVDSDGDGFFNEVDPDNDNPCIPSNFGSGCTLDFDGDGTPDSQEGGNNNTDTTGGYVSDAYPDWIESLILGVATYLGLDNPSGIESDPDGDGITNQLDPNNNNKCVPNTGFDLSCAGTPPPPPPPSAIQGVDCASMPSLPPGAKLYYIYMY